MDVVRRIVAFVALVAMTTLASPVSYAQLQSPQPAVHRRPITLREGQRVSAVLKDGQHVGGRVGTVFRRGFDIHQLDGTRLFVEYRLVSAFLDPDTGAVIGDVPREPLARWERRALIAIVTFSGIAIATRGVIPACFFMRCFG